VSDRVQTRLEQANLHRIGYVGKRLHDIAIDYSTYLGGRSTERWLRDVAAELIHQADGLAGQRSLLDEGEVTDTVLEQIAGATTGKTLDRIVSAYADRWQPWHDMAVRRRRDELDRARGG